ncbi:carbamoyltransferase HypF [Deltaproteobacteria bacterium]|nr:carbamoyltransferase HypF [Deltaproteobacteria bacterium]
MLPLIIRRVFTATGQVQGVGFRPFVYRLAREEELTGSVGNTSDGVRVEVQGESSRVGRFAVRLRKEAPPLARIVSLDAEDKPPLPDEKGFVITASCGRAGHNVLVSPDVGICAACLADMCDPANRRYAYPFANCTNCGPRYTITRVTPYDRATTTMSCFPLCPDCAAEYANPADRRFHAQPISCPVCGPRLWFVAKGLPESGPTAENQRNALARAGNTLLCGGILAFKGLGGFQLVCNARDISALRELRRRKSRPHKPFALMVGDVAVAQTLCDLTPEHEALLQSPEKPIVLCPRASGGELPAEVGPDMKGVGLMLPCTPLHAALFNWLAARAAVPPMLVMTSGNAGGEPICLGNREAVTRLVDMADAWLLHDMDILSRVDDSVLALQPTMSGAGAAAPLFFRRARGYVPTPVFLPGDGPCVLGAGAELKSAVCLTRGTAAFVGQHIGDLENPATLAFYKEVATRLETLLEIQPKAIVCDLHPDFLSTRYALARAAGEGLPVMRLQHHAAHAASVLAENNCYEAALVLCIDGAGLGGDGTVWGGEVIFMDIAAARWRRVGRLAPFPLPGGDAATREPWRIALALRKRCGAQGLLPSEQGEKGHARAEAAVREMLVRNLNCPLTSSCGRLFDAVAAQLNLCRTTTYEGQAAVRLEGVADAALLENSACLPLPVTERDGLLTLDSIALFDRVVTAQRDNEPVAAIAAWFHASLARGLADMAANAARACGVDKVGLSGGVMQNAIMARLLPRFLEERGLTSLAHHALPPGDGGLSLGQAVWGRRMLQ